MVGVRCSAQGLRASVARSDGRFSWGQSKGPWSWILPAAQQDQSWTEICALLVCCTARRDRASAGVHCSGHTNDSPALRLIRSPNVRDNWKAPRLTPGGATTAEIRFRSVVARRGRQAARRWLAQWRRRNRHDCNVNLRQGGCV